MVPLLWGAGLIHWSFRWFRVSASYTVKIPLARFYVLDESEKLETFILKCCQMRVGLEVQNPICPLYGYPNHNMIPCWQGKVVSNVLQLPN